MSTTPETAEEYAARQAHEWSQFVAIAPILHDGVLAYHPGMPVPADNVERHKYLDAGLVARTTTKAAKAVTEKDA